MDVALAFIWFTAGMLVASLIFLGADLLVKRL